MVLVQKPTLRGHASPQLDYGMSARASAMVAAMQVGLAQVVGGLSAVSNDSNLFQRGATLAAKARQDYREHCVSLPFGDLEFEVRL